MNLTEIAKRSVNVFEVSMTPEEFCDRYKESLEEVGVVGEDERDKVEHAKSALGLNENDIVMGQQKVGFPCSFFLLFMISSRSSSLKRLSTSSRTSFALKTSRNRNGIVSTMLKLQLVLLSATRILPTRRGSNTLVRWTQ